MKYELIFGNIFYHDIFTDISKLLYAKEFVALVCV